MVQNEKIIRKYVNALSSAAEVKSDLLILHIVINSMNNLLKIYKTLQLLIINYSYTFNFLVQVFESFRSDMIVKKTGLEKTSHLRGGVSGVETASHAGHCLINLLLNWNWSVHKVHGEQDKSGENRSKCLVCIHTPGGGMKIVG